MRTPFSTAILQHCNVLLTQIVVVQSLKTFEMPFIRLPNTVLFLVCCRGQGVGKALMQTAVQQSCTLWGATSVYTCVDADNEIAFRLYKSCGFTELTADSGSYDGALDLGRVVLLKLQMDPGTHN